MSEKTLTQTLGATIAAKRKQMGLSQESLAEKIGVSQESLSRMEKGGIAPKFERLRTIAAALDCSVADLFRTEHEINDEHAATLADILRPLSPLKRQTLLRIFAEISHMVKDV